MGDKNIMTALRHSDCRKSYKKIKRIATEKALDFTDSEVDIHSFKVSPGRYLFYQGISNAQNLMKSLQNKRKIRNLNLPLNFFGQDERSQFKN